MCAQECHKEKERREFVAIDIGSRGYRGKEKQLINKGEEKSGRNNLEETRRISPSGDEMRGHAKVVRCLPHVLDLPGRSRSF